MLPMKERLKTLPREINVAIVGIGSIGNGLVYQCFSTPGFKPVAIADLKLEKAIKCAEDFGIEYAIVSNAEELENAIKNNKMGVCGDAYLLCSCEAVDVMIEASNAVLEGAMHALKAIEHNQHVVMMNYEAELLYGPYLLQKSKEEGVVYTCADGDQPTVIKKLVDDITFWGFDLVMAGNIKGYLDRYTDPTKIIPEADKRNLDHKMCSSYTDGSKLCVEMAVLANALNLKTAVPGMYGHRTKSVHDIFDLINFEELWQNKQPVVDYLVGAEPKGGVFVIGYTENKFQQYTLEWFPPTMGPGPFYLFYRPYHLGHIEALECVAEAFLDGTARLQPTYGIQTNVYTYAKKDLQAGDVIDGMGGYASYGLIENIEDQEVNPGLPILLSENVRLKRAVGKDQKIYMSDVEYNPNDPAFDLYFKSLNLKNELYAIT